MTKHNEIAKLRADLADARKKIVDCVAVMDEQGKRLALQAQDTDILFDGPPGPEAGRFVEVEDMQRRSIRVGEWIDRGDGYWALRMRVVR